MKNPKTDLEKGIAALIIVTALFASLSVLARFLNTDFTILQQVYLRVFAALLIAMVVFRKYIRWHTLTKIPRREWLIVALRAFISYGVAVTLISKAATLTLLGNVAFIGALPFVPLLGFIFLKEKVTWWKLTFIFGAILGVALLSVHDLHNLLSWGRGDVYAIIATLAFAVGYVSRKWHGPALNNHEITTLTFVFGVLWLFGLSLAIGEGLPAVDSVWTIWVAVALGGVFNVASLFLTNYSFQHVDAVRAGNLLNLEAAWGLLFGLTLYHEWPTWQGLSGGVLILACVIGMNLYSKRAEAKNAPIQFDV